MCPQKTHLKYTTSCPKHKIAIVRPICQQRQILHDDLVIRTISQENWCFFYKWIKIKVRFLGDPADTFLDFNEVKPCLDFYNFYFNY